MPPADEDHVAKRHIDRVAERVPIHDGSVKMRQPGAKSIDVGIEDLSVAGCRVEWPHRANVGDRLWVKLGKLEPIPATVAWAKDFRVGCQFEAPLHPAVFASLIGVKN